MFSPNALLHLCTLISVDARGLVGIWPLSEASHGKNLVRDGPDVQLHDVLFAEDAGPWRSSPAQFLGSDQSYASGGGDDLLITHSFSWMGAIWFDHYHTGYLLSYNRGSDDLTFGPRVRLHYDNAYVEISYGSCVNYIHHSVVLSRGEWHILAAAVDYENKIMSLWADGQQETRQLDTCDTTALCGNTFYSGIRCV